MLRRADVPGCLAACTRVPAPVREMGFVLGRRLAACISNAHGIGQRVACALQHVPGRATAWAGSVQAAALTARGRPVWAGQWAACQRHQRLNAHGRHGLAADRRRASPRVVGTAAVRGQTSFDGAVAA